VSSSTLQISLTLLFTAVAVTVVAALSTQGGGQGARSHGVACDELYIALNVTEVEAAA
jgi:hypothetical protein